VREGVAGAGEAKVQRAGVADAGDVEGVAMEEQREREDRVEAGAVEVERSGGPATFEIPALKGIGVRPPRPTISPAI
jgi:hypothetical protein